MHPRPFYRSRLFWLGIPGLVFLLWGWWLSMGHSFGAGLPGKQSNWGVSQSAGAISTYWDLDGWPELEAFRASDYEREWADPDYEKWWMVKTRTADPSFRFVRIPYPAVVLTYTAAWLLTLAWWQRRKSRLLNLHAVP